MQFLDLPRLETSALARRTALEILPRRQGVKGSISRQEAEFLLCMIEREDVRAAIEIGVASGGSTLYMLAMLSRLGGDRKLYALDLAEAYYPDPSRAVGFLALDSEFNQASRLALYPRACVADLRRLVGAPNCGPRFDLAFIDGEHLHPWPALDLLFLLPWLRDGAVVVLHDINMPQLLASPHGFGPQWLFDCPFPERVVAPGGAPNIGAFRIIDRADAVGLVLRLLATPWECDLSAEARAAFAAEIAQGPLAAYVTGLTPYFARPSP